MSDLTQSSQSTPEGGKPDPSQNGLISYFQSGPGKHPSVWSAKDMNRLVAILRAFQQMTVQISDAEPNPDGTYTALGKLVIGGEKAILELLLAPNGGGSGNGNMTYANEYDLTKAYSQYTVVRVSPANSAATTATPAGGTLPGVYISIQTIPANGTQPKHPLQAGGENAYWNWLSTWPSYKTDCDESGNTVNSITDSQPKPA